MHFNKPPIIGNELQYIQETISYGLPLQLSTMGKEFDAKVGDYPVSEDISDRLIRLPFHNDIDLIGLNHFHDF